MKLSVDSERRPLRYRILHMLLLCVIVLNGCSTGENTQTTERLLTEESSDNVELIDVETETMDEVNAAIESETSAEGSFQMTMLDVGQGLSILIEADDQYMLYDGGGRQSSSYVVSYLEHNGITSLDYMVASHYDEDHIAGLIGCLHNYPVGTLVCPDYETDTNIYESFLHALSGKDTLVEYPEVGTTYSLGQGIVTVLGPESSSGGEGNDSSIVMRVDYGDFSCILTGDAEAGEEQYMIDRGANLKADLLVAGHHGSQYSSTQSFLKAVSPKVVWISCGLENTYGHPATETMESLKSMNIDLYRTDLQGEVICRCDGRRCSFNVDACRDYSCGDLTVQQLELEPIIDDESSDVLDRGMPTVAESEDEREQEYVLNTNTKKIHYPHCSSVNQMKEKNRKAVVADREDLIAQGYSPCGNCHP